MRVWDTSHLLDDIPAHKQASAEHVYDPADSQANLYRIRFHFKQLQARLILGLVLGFLLPNALLSAYFHFQFTHTLKESAKLSLAAVAESQKNTIDLYLQERVVNLYNLFHSKDFSLNPTQEQMDTLLANLKHFNDGFVDVGFFDPKGVQIAYAGPFHALLGMDYSHESWYRNLLEDHRNYLISDIYLGFRKIPHFTIAIKQVFDNQTYMMRASLDPDKFYIFLRAISQGKEVESTLINHEGIYQVVDPGRSQFPNRSDFIPPTASPAGVEEFERDDQKMLVAFTPIKETPWTLLAMQPVSVAQAGMIKARLVLTISLVVISLLLSAIIFFTIKRLVDRARRMAEKGQQLQEMLAHASKLASIGELAAGVAHEINNPLAIIMATSGVIRDMLNPEFELDHSPEAIYKELSVIDTAANRAKGITRKLQDMGKSRVPSVVECDVNALLGEVVASLKKVELKPKHIEIANNLASDLPRIFAEPEPLRQVFANILINASDAIDDKGTISITTEAKEDTILVTITDSGRGIPPENLPRIFNPFFTTKGGGRGTGLGLSIAASIVKYLGGVIRVNSIPGTGSSFTILLPINAQAQKTIKQHDK
ncbi:MAG: histidine kinase [Desulfobulbus sp.]|jgi:two-component system NtrC family sensor kinase|uniref:sensor histidine kinase n=1 Tax=Desulfobulbus sp. TaxID=895 RepID=UPI00284D8C88|nr:ATP-binding protein [Desulfobulbus sp.]MDR2551139.1 histidine kinase [Desulfobulbus sp.]